MASKKAKASSSNKSNKVYRLKISLNGITPPIWRQLLVASDTTLLHLHLIIQAAMPWENGHLFAFQVGKVEYGLPMDGGFAGSPTINAGEHTLAEIAATPGARFTYLYDFGDSWEHSIQVEEIRDRLPSEFVPTCIKGKRNCPPEDCGGVWGYADLLKTLSNPKHPEHKNLLEWLGDEFDPEHFDLNETNTRLAEVAEIPDEIILSEDVMPVSMQMMSVANPIQMLQDFMASVDDNLDDWMSPRRSQMVVQVIRHIANFVADHDLGFVTASGTLYQIGRQELSPAVAFIAKGQIDRLPDGGVLTILPNLVVEVEYPDNPDVHEETAADIRAYRRAKITIWHFEPHKQQVSVYLPNQRVKKLGLDDVLDGGTILPGFTLAVKDIVL